MIELSDQDLLSRLANFEDAFVERKSTGDMRDLLKTAVGFANSTPVGYPAILFYGVTNQGEPEGKANLDSLQRTLSEKLSEAYPPIYYLPRVLRHKGKEFLAVIIPGSEDKPHFAGQSYIRDGAQTRVASEAQFTRLIAERNSKAREILKWKDKDITMERTYTGRSGRYPAVAKVADCNVFYVTLLQGTDPISFTLTRLDISYDDKERRLKLEIREHAI